MYEYVGNVHIHSKYSDGTLSIQEIASIAAEVGLDFIVITDHENLEGLKNKEEGYHNGVLTLVGMEVNDTCCHYLAMDINDVVNNNTADPQEVIDEVNKQVGIGVIAHPLEKGSPLYEKGITFCWTDCNVRGFQGIEIWNFVSQWKDGISNIFKGIYLLINPHAALTGPYPEVMQKYDFLQRRGEKIAAFGGSDSHNVKIRIGFIPVTIGSYQYCFKCINMHIILEKPLSGVLNHDKEMVYSALKTGKAWVAYDYFKNSRGFSYVLQTKERDWQMGSAVEYQNGMEIIVKTPYYAKVHLIKDGKLNAISKGTVHGFKNINRGVYRIEAYHKHYFSYRPWIFSNSIWVK